MSHSIRQVCQRNPMWYFESNYQSLFRIIDEGQLREQGSMHLELSGVNVRINLLEQTPYTLLVEFKQYFANTSTSIPALDFIVRLYLDARLAEVVSYQGVKHLQARYTVPNTRMYHPDEKKQRNILLHDWLSYYCRLKFRESEVIKSVN